MTRLLIRRDGDNDWRTPEVTAYDNEGALQRLLAESPHLLPGIEEEAVATAREFPVLETGSADLVAVDIDGGITIVECKLQRNPEIKRRIVGQLFAYAAGMMAMSFDEFETAFSQAAGRPLLRQIAEYSDSDGVDEEAIRSTITENLQAGRFRLIIAVDEITPELQRIVRYINQHTTGDVELLAIELRYIRHSDVEILVPEVYGEETAATKPSTRRRGVWSEEELFALLRENVGNHGYQQAQRLRDYLRGIGGRYRGGAGKATAGRFLLPIADHYVFLVAFFSQGQVWRPDWPDYVALNFSNLVDALPSSHVRAFTDALGQNTDLATLVYANDGSLNNWIDIPIESTLTQPGVLETLEQAIEELVRCSSEINVDEFEH